MKRPNQQAWNICRANTHAHTTFLCLLTVQSHIVVGEDGRLVPFWCTADHHMQHPIRGLNIMFLWNTDTLSLTGCFTQSSHLLGRTFTARWVTWWREDKKNLHWSHNLRVFNSPDISVSGTQCFAIDNLLNQLLIEFEHLCCWQHIYADLFSFHCSMKGEQEVFIFIYLSILSF